MAKIFMLIGASRPNIPIIDMAKSIGFEVVVTDINPHAEGLLHGDYNYVISARDTEGLCGIAIKHNIDCVYSGTDINFSVGAINDIMRICGFPLLVGFISQYKHLFKTYLSKEHSIPYRLVTNEKEAVEAYDLLGGVAVVKASDLSSSKGIKKVHSRREVMRAFKECKGHSNEDTLIVESFIEGTCHDANGLVVAWEDFHPCGIIDREFVETGNYFVQRRMTCPTRLPEGVQDRMYDIMRGFARARGVVTSPIKADFLYNEKEDKIYMLEFGPRFHGEMGFLHMIPNAISIRAMEAYLRYRYKGRGYQGGAEENLLEEKRIDTAVCVAIDTPGAESNYDIDKYVINFDNREPIEISIK